MVYLCSLLFQNTSCLPFFPFYFQLFAVVEGGGVCLPNAGVRVPGGHDDSFAFHPIVLTFVSSPYCHPYRWKGVFFCSKRKFMRGKSKVPTLQWAWEIALPGSGAVNNDLLMVFFLEMINKPHIVCPYRDDVIVDCLWCSGKVSLVSWLIEWVKGFISKGILCARFLFSASSGQLRRTGIWFC